MINDITTDIILLYTTEFHTINELNLLRQFCASSSSINSLSKAAYHVVLWEGREGDSIYVMTSSMNMMTS